MNLPEGFIRSISDCGASQFNGLIDALQSSQPVVSVRFNPLRQASAPTGWLDRVAWCDDGVYLPTRFPFTFDPAMHQGIYYVQDASSMFLQQALVQVIQRFFSEGSRPLTVLDACAAPGGKTGCIANVVTDGSLIVANEFSTSRCEVLMENLSKCGYPHTLVTRCDAACFANAGELFDIIVLDAPCSGEGMMRKEPVAVDQWSESLVANCAAIQRNLAVSLWKALRPGGVLIYSTCTFNRTENEEIASLIASQPGAVPVELNLDPEWNIQPGIDTSLPCMRFIPGLTRGEGLFMTVFNKAIYSHSSVSDSKRKLPRRKHGYSLQEISSAKSIEPFTSWLHSDESIAYFNHEDASGPTVLAIDSRHLPIVQALMDASVPIVQCGTPIGVLKGKDWLPTQELALDLRLNHSAFPVCEVSADDALAFLRRESLVLPSDVSRGIVLLLYNGSPLGFVKNIGNRANNLYPKSWRVISGRQPQSLYSALSLNSFPLTDPKTNISLS